MKKILALLCLGLASQGLAGMEQSYSPILGYNPSQGAILGAAAFLKDETNYFSLQGLGTPSNVYAGIFNARHKIHQALELSLDNNFSNFYDLYFGEGMQTRLQDQVRIDQTRYLGKAGALLSVGGLWHLGPFVDYRSRQNTGPSPVEGESTLVVGASVRRDGRDDEFQPKRGSFAELSAGQHPSLDGGPTFSQASLDLRSFQSLGSVVLAGRLSGGSSWGDPSYLFRYKIGGPDQLRGLFENRLRGKLFACAQMEARFPVYRALSGDLFADAGEVGENALKGDALSSFGAGLRIALPPDGLMVVRIDYGQARDQSGLYVSFGHAF